MEWALLVEALVAGEPLPNTVDRPFRQFHRTVPPGEHDLDILDLLLRPAKSGKELLDIKKFCGKLKHVIVGAGPVRDLVSASRDGIA